VDAALVIRYFGSKQDLFATATDFTIDLPDLSHVDPDDVPDLLLPRYFAVWEEDHTFLALLRAAPDHHLERIALTNAFVIGLATTRSVLANPPVADLSREELSRWAGPVFRQLLTGPAPA
jgi:AcrR family transcriptional regulator